MPAGAIMVTLRFRYGLFVTVNKEDFLGLSCLVSTTSIMIGFLGVFITLSSSLSIYTNINVDNFLSNHIPDIYLPEDEEDLS
jgi:hypothetical protein